MRQFAQREGDGLRFRFFLDCGNFLVAPTPYSFPSRTDSARESLPGPVLETVHETFALIQLPGGRSLSRHPAGSGSLAWPSGPFPVHLPCGARQFRRPASGHSPCPRYTPVAGVLRRITPSGVSAFRPFVSPVSLSVGFPGSIRFWAHPSPRPIRSTSCSVVERWQGVTPFPITVCRCGQGGTFCREDEE